jgi:hypothetical protein
MNGCTQLGSGVLFHCVANVDEVVGNHTEPDPTLHPGIAFVRIAVNGADKAEPAQDGGRGVKVSDGCWTQLKERRAFQLRGQC